MILCLLFAPRCSEKEQPDQAAGSRTDLQPGLPSSVPGPSESVQPAEVQLQAAAQKAPKDEIVTDIVPKDSQNLYGVVEWSMANIYEKPDLLSERIGYYRGGTTILLGERVKATNPKSPKCVHGWYRLLDGDGYICASKGFQIASVLIKSPDQISPPTTDELLPYRYGRIMVDFTPLYERLPSAEEEAMLEKYVAEKKKEMLAEKKAKEQKEMEAQRDKLKAEILKEQKAVEHVTPEADGAEEAVKKAEADAVKTEAPAPEEPGAPSEPGPKAAEKEAAGEPEAKAEKKPPAAPKPSSDEGAQKEGEGEEEPPKEEIPFSYVGALLMRGFYLSIDSEVKWGGKRWYRTTRGKYVRFEPVLAVNPISSHGYMLKDDESFPVGIVLRKNIFARKWNSAGTHLVKNKDIVYDKFFGFAVKKNVNDLGKLYFQVDDEGQNFILSWSVAVLRKAVERPPEIPENSKWIHVDIGDQTLTAYEGSRPVYATLVSSGAEKKDEEFATPRGLYWIVSKNVTATMANLALDEEAYWIEDVPWTMYFYKSYALHGAFWHNVFGNQRSHGCVNLAPADARWLFYWSEPALPLGWHGVYTVKKQKGTPVYITD